VAGTATIIVATADGGKTATCTVTVTQAATPTYTITAVAASNGSVSPSGSVSVNQGDSQTFYFYPDTGYEIGQVLIDGENNTTAVTNGSYTFVNVTDNHTIFVTFTQSCLPKLVVQIWDNVLSVVNNADKNGGYRFVTYQWQRNGTDMAGETNGYLYFGTAKDYTAEYSVRLLTSSGQTVQSCPIHLRTVETSLRSYPNPTSGIVTVEDASIQAGEKIEIYDINGQLVKRFSATKNQTTIDISALQRGTYILKINNKQVKIIKN
jgi:hypothetical protein